MMNVQDLVLKYAIAFNKRFTRKQKNAFVNEIGKDFKSLGYPVRGAVAKKRGTAALNLMVGDVAHADTLIVVNYDTPQHNFGNPMAYYPFDGPSTFTSSLLPIYTPLILGSVVLLYGLFKVLPSLNFSSDPVYSALIVLAFILLSMLSFIMTRGVANKVNFNRNTSGVIATLKLAEELSEQQRKKVAFVLTDGGCTNHSGDYMLREALPTTIDQRLVILMDCIGDGEEFVIGYKEESEKQARDLAECFAQKPKRHKCPKEDLRYTSFSFYAKSLLIARGTFKGDAFTVRNVSTNKDTVINEEALLACVSALKKYL